MSCQELPGFAKSCQELPGIVRSCQELPESATARSCQELPGAGRSCLPIFPLFSCLGSRAGVIFLNLNATPANLASEASGRNLMCF